jgi:hypothetical protein
MKGQTTMSDSEMWIHCLSYCNNCADRYLDHLRRSRLYKDLYCWDAVIVVWIAIRIGSVIGTVASRVPMYIDACNAW